MLCVQVAGTHGFHTSDEEKVDFTHTSPRLADSHLARPGCPPLQQ